METVYIVGAARTPIGGLQGSFLGTSASELGGAAIAGALSAAEVATDQVDELLMGCVLAAGQGQAPARQAGFSAALSENVPATTVNKMCGSGMKTTMMGYDKLALNGNEVVVVGGMESMTQAPYLLPKMRSGARLGHGQVHDSMFLDGLEDAYDQRRLMGTFAEDCATKFQFTREAQDAYALLSLERALNAQFSGAFDAEIVPVSCTTHKEPTQILVDEQPGNAKPEKIQNLKPAFRDGGTVTAANSSSISDGAAALVLAGQSAVDALSLMPRARIRGHASHAQEPGWFTTAPVPAAKKLLNKVGWSIEEVDLWEVNEAFAVVPMAFIHEMNLSSDIVNIHGGACALGHPIGASGARIIVTLLNALELHGLKRGVAAICIGGGEGTAIAIERI